MPYSAAPNRPSVTKIVTQRARMARLRKRRNRRMNRPGSPECATLGFFKIQTPSSGAKTAAPTQDAISAMATTAKIEKVSIARRAAGETDRNEPSDRNQRAREPGKRSRAVGETRRGLLLVPMLKACNRGFDGYHLVINEEAKGDDQRAEQFAEALSRRTSSPQTPRRAREGSRRQLPHPRADPG